MKETLPPPIAAYIDASNDRQVEALIACFTPDAVVVDEGHTYRGSTELRTWFARTVEAYDFTQDPFGKIRGGALIAAWATAEPARP
jgi:ketosteroid isomerase-like protein